MSIKTIKIINGPTLQNLVYSLYRLKQRQNNNPKSSDLDVVHFITANDMIPVLIDSLKNPHAASMPDSDEIIFEGHVTNHEDPNVYVSIKGTYSPFRRKGQATIEWHFDD
jgi:hypothetical protein